MRRFFDDTSSAKIFTKGDLIGKALNAKSGPYFYELRNYDMDTGKYERVGTYYTKEMARVGKAFYEMEFGLAGVAIVAVFKHQRRTLSPAELKYIASDEQFLAECIYADTDSVKFAGKQGGD